MIDYKLPPDIKLYSKKEIMQMGELITEKYFCIFDQNFYIVFIKDGKSFAKQYPGKAGFYLINKM
jgi:hypothetical protein